jgi:hypothetical protein
MAAKKKNDSVQTKQATVEAAELSYDPVWFEFGDSSIRLDLVEQYTRIRQSVEQMDVQNQLSATLGEANYRLPVASSIAAVKLHMSSGREVVLEGEDAERFLNDVDWLLPGLKDATEDEPKVSVEDDEPETKLKSEPEPETGKETETTI